MRIAIEGCWPARQADLARAQASLASSRAVLEAQKRQRSALDTKDAVYRADIQAKKAAIIVVGSQSRIYAHCLPRRQGLSASVMCRRDNWSLPACRSSIW